jgi:hypothetical protein
VEKAVLLVGAEGYDVALSLGGSPATDEDIASFRDQLGNVKYEGLRLDSSGRPYYPVTFLKQDIAKTLWERVVYYDRVLRLV